MASLLIGHTNMALDVAPTLSSNATTNSATALQEPIVATKVRSSDASTWRIRLDFGAARTVDTVGVFGTNAGAMTVQTGTTLGAQNVGNDTGTVDTAHGVALALCAAPRTAQHLQVSLSAPVDPSTYLEAGYLWVGVGWRPTYGHGFDFGLGYDDGEAARETEGGQTYSVTRYLRRTFDLRLQAVGRAEADTHFRALGLTRHLLVCSHTADALPARRAMFARRTNNVVYQGIFALHGAIDLNLVEVL